MSLKGFDMQSLTILLCISSLTCFVGFFALVFTGHLRDDNGMYAGLLAGVGAVFLGLAFVSASVDALASNPDEAAWRRHGQQDLLHFGWYMTGLGVVLLVVFGGIHFSQTRSNRANRLETTRNENNQAR